MTQDDAAYFFLTYAHTGQRPLVERLFDALCEEIWERTRWPNHVHPGFMDRRDISTGADWRTAVAGALGDCRVLVPLYSPKYFNSPECGREFHAFNCRVVEHHALHGGSMRPIVPALWTPVPDQQIPEAVRYLHADFGAVHPSYAEAGLYTLVKNSRYRSTYLQVVRHLALQIIEYADHEPPMHPTDAGQVDVSKDAFRPDDGPDDDGPRQAVATPLAVMVAAPTTDRLPANRSADFYGSEPAAWAPYQPAMDRPIADLVNTLARSHDYEPRPVSLEKGLDRRLWTEPESGIGIVLVDPWVAADADLLDQVRQIDRAGGGRVGVLTVWDPLDAQTRLGAAHLRADPLPGTTQMIPVNDFESVLTAVLTRATNRWLNEGPPDHDAFRA